MGPFTDGWTSEDVFAVLDRDDPAEVVYVPIVIGMEASACGTEWAQTICQRLSCHPAHQIRSNALLGLSHIARTTKCLNLDLAIPALERALADMEAQVRVTAREVVEDLKVFMGEELASHPAASGLLTRVEDSDA